jgi:hypothetical protein
MPHSYWRSRARPIIAKVLRETKGQDEKVIREALFEAYPFGQRQYHPYKIWCDEIRRQRGLLPPKKPKKAPPPDPNQLGLFED